MLIADSDVDEKKSWNLLGDCLKDMTSLIAAALLERVLILTSLSVRALLTVCGEMETEIYGRSSQVQCDFSSVILHSIRYVRVRVSYRSSPMHHSIYFNLRYIHLNEVEYSVILDY